MRRDISPDLMFLSETKNPDAFVLRKLDSSAYQYLLIPPEGHGSGGLALFWKQELNLTVRTYSKNYIDVSIIYEGKELYATFIYGDTDKSKRKQLWDHLTTLSYGRDSPWFLSGDFNDIMGTRKSLEAP